MFEFVRIGYVSPRSGLGSLGRITARGRAYTDPFPLSAAPVGGWALSPTRLSVSHPAAATIQRQLNSLGFLDYERKLLIEDGNFGGRTYSAYVDLIEEALPFDVRDELRKLGNPPGQPSRAVTLLEEMAAALAQPALPPAPEPTPTTSFAPLLSMTAAQRLATGSTVQVAMTQEQATATEAKAGIPIPLVPAASPNLGPPIQPAMAAPSWLAPGWSIWQVQRFLRATNLATLAAADAGAAGCTAAPCRLAAKADEYLVVAVQAATRRAGSAVTTGVPAGAASILIATPTHRGGLVLSASSQPRLSASGDWTTGVAARAEVVVEPPPLPPTPTPPTPTPPSKRGFGILAAIAAGLWFLARRS